MKFIIKILNKIFAYYTRILNKIFAYDTIVNGCNELKIKGLNLDSQVDIVKIVLSKFKEGGII